MLVYSSTKKEVFDFVDFQLATAERCFTIVQHDKEDIMTKQKYKERGHSNE